MLKAAKESKDGYPLLMEQRLEYVLTTGGNWALGTIGDFKLTIDKGKKENLISFCGEGVKKTGPTTFEVTAKDYYPDHDLAILILSPYAWEAPAPMAAPAASIKRSRPAPGQPPIAPGKTPEPKG